LDLQTCAKRRQTSIGCEPGYKPWAAHEQTL
jgi:hypothetical protein